MGGRAIYYAGRRLDADVLRELARQDPKRLAAMLGVGHAVRNHVGGVERGLDRVMAGRLGVDAEDVRPTVECGLFETEDDLGEAVADTLYADAANMVVWLSEGRPGRHETMTCPTRIRPDSKAPMVFASVRVDDVSNAVSVRAVSGVRASFVRDDERPLGIKSVTCYPCALPGEAPRELSRRWLHDAMPSTRAYASASTTQRLALLATTFVPHGVTVSYDARRDRLALHDVPSGVTYAIDATPRGLRVTRHGLDGSLRIWPGDGGWADGLNAGMREASAWDGSLYAAVAQVVADAERMGCSMSACPQQAPRRPRTLADFDDAPDDDDDERRREIDGRDG